MKRRCFFEIGCFAVPRRASVVVRVRINVGPGVFVRDDNCADVRMQTSKRELTSPSSLRRLRPGFRVLQVSICWSCITSLTIREKGPCRLLVFAVRREGEPLIARPTAHKSRGTLSTGE